MRLEEIYYLKAVNSTWQDFEKLRVEHLSYIDKDRINCSPLCRGSKSPGLCQCKRQNK